MPRSHPTAFQWRSEVPIQGDELDTPIIYPDDEHSAALVIDLLRTDDLTFDQLDKPPFTRLSTSLLTAIREDALHAGIFKDASDVDRAHHVQDACVLHLNRLASDIARDEVAFAQVVRDFALLSLVGPHAVPRVLCDWGMRQSVAARQAAVCRILFKLRFHLSSRETGPGAVVAWTVKRMESCKMSKGELSIFCAWLEQMLISQHQEDGPLIGVAKCLQHVIIPILERDDKRNSAIVTSCFDFWARARIVFNAGIETAVRTAELLATYLSFEKRAAGELEQASWASKALTVLIQIVPSAMAQEIQIRFRNALPFPLLDPKQVRVELKHTLQNIRRERTNEMRRLPHDGMLPVYFLRQCERIILMVASTGFVNRQIVKSPEKSTEAVLAGFPQIFWVAALTRQLPLLTPEEVVTAFENVENGLLPLELLDNTLVAGQKEVYGETQDWCCFLAFSHIAVSAIVVLMNNENLPRQQPSNRTVVLHVTRNVCSVFVSVTSRDRREAPPFFLYSCLLFELNNIISAYDEQHIPCFSQHKQVADILLMTISEITRQFGMKFDKNSMPAKRCVQKIEEIFQSPSKGSQPWTRSICEHVLKILSDREVILPQR